MSALTLTNGRGQKIGDVLAASIAHEVKQPLAAIVMSAAAGFRFLDNSPPDLESAREAFRRIVADGRRASEVVEDIRSSFDSDAEAGAGLCVINAISAAIAAKRGDLDRHDVRVQLARDRVLPAVRCNRVHLHQVIVNLIANAIEAMSGTSAPRLLQLSAWLDRGGQVVVAVADSGPGIAPDAAGRIFEPLYTTKSHRMGMGLAICRAIIEAHQGSLWFTPNAPTGALFRFTLPAADSLR